MPQSVAAQYVNILQQYFSSLTQQSDIYQQVFTHQRRHYSGKELPALRDIDSIKLFIKSEFKLYNARVEIPILNGELHSIPELTCQLYDRYAADNYAQFCLTEGTGACLCVMSNSDLMLVPTNLLRGNKQIISVLQFASSLKQFKFGSYGCFSFCENLIYIPPIPEGVTDLELAFHGCTSLDCPIFLPSTAKNVKDMLKGCTSFNNKIYGESFLSCTGSEEYLQFYGGSYKKSTSI